MFLRNLNLYKTLGTIYSCLEKKLLDIYVLGYISQGPVKRPPIVWVSLVCANQNGFPPPRILPMNILTLDYIILLDIVVRGNLRVELGFKHQPPLFLHIHTPAIVVPFKLKVNRILISGLPFKHGLMGSYSNWFIDWGQHNPISLVGKLLSHKLFEV